MLERINKAYDAINKLGGVAHISIAHSYLKLREAEHRLRYEMAQRKQQEQEEQREIRERARDEERAQREIAQAVKEDEKREQRQEAALAKLREEMSRAHGAELEALKRKHDQEEQQLKEIIASKERKKARAEMTKDGYVYVISNIGSFGENVYKIGLTRREDPQERVDELGDASVPFRFDIHAVIHSADAPALEAELHRHFDGHRVNAINRRKEFFAVTLDEIARVVSSKGHSAQFTMLAEAAEFRMTTQARVAGTVSTNADEGSERPAVLPPPIRRPLFAGSGKA